GSGGWCRPASGSRARCPRAPRRSSSGSRPGTRAAEPLRRPRRPARPRTCPGGWRAAFAGRPPPDRSPTLSPVHRLTRKQARRVAVRAQLLDAPRPADLLTVVQRLTFLQIDPTAAVAPSADLVAWSRLGSAYRPEDLKQALEADRTLFEF